MNIDELKDIGPLAVDIDLSERSTSRGAVIASGALSKITNILSNQQTLLLVGEGGGVDALL